LGLALCPGSLLLSSSEGFDLNRTIQLLITIILVILLIGLLPTWPYSSGWGWGYYPSGGVGLLVIIIVVILLLGNRGK
jgi:uncharacterized membrane protein